MQQGSTETTTFTQALRVFSHIRLPIQFPISQRFPLHPVAKAWKICAVFHLRRGNPPQTHRQQLVASHLGTQQVCDAPSRFSATNTNK